MVRISMVIHGVGGGGGDVYVLCVCVHGLASFWVCIHGSSQWSVVSVNVDSDRQRIIL